VVKVLANILFLLAPFLLIGQNEYAVARVTTGINGTTYSPAFLMDQLVVCGTRKDRIAITVIDSTGNEPSDLYIIDPNSPQNFNRFSSVFRTNYHDGPLSFNAEGNALVISKNMSNEMHPAKLKSRRSTLGLFSSVKGTVDWTNPVSLPFNSEKYNCTHPSLSLDGNTLIFTSDMPGGFGGYDLYISKKTEGNWSKPINLGPSVNSSAQEVFPTIIGEQLCFSSNRTGSNGLDIYTSSNLGLDEAQRLPAPINSLQDDFGIISNNDFKSGYFSSNRDGEDALWTFEFLHPTFIDCDTMVVNNYCYHLAEENALTLDEIPSLIYQWDINGKKIRSVEFDYCFSGPGDYEISIDIFDTLVDQLYANQDYYLLTLEPEFQPYITGSDTILANQPFTLSSANSYLPGVTIESYYWFVDDSLCGLDSNFTWTFNRIGEHSVRLGITGTFEGAPFQDCSQKTMRCADELLDSPPLPTLPAFISLANDSQIVEETHGIEMVDSSIVLFSVEIARTEKELSIADDLPTEITSKYVIHSRFDTNDSTYSYGVGEYDEITDAYDTWREIVTYGQDATVRSFVQETVYDIPINQVFELDNILFESNKSVINEQFYPNLDRLFSILSEVDKLHLTIEAHTDNIGSTSNNQKLSVDRANAILNYLVDSGIKRERIHAAGYGEDRPIASNDSEEGREKNRRVAFKFYVD
jgi:outer membrane protein OmpA-like peptidoglycan-associated protein